MNKEQIKHLFKSYPEQPALHVTSDGSIYLDGRSATEYANRARLTDTEVVTVTREEAEGWAAAKAAKATEVQKHILSEEDLAANPDLAANGLKAGDEIEIPAPAKTAIPAATKKPAAKKAATGK